MKQRFFIGALVIMCSCFIYSCKPATDSDTSVINGVETSDYPAVVQIEIAQRSLCSAGIVSDNTLLTAAHCVCHDYVKSPSDIAVVINGKKHLAKQYSYHNKYSLNQEKTWKYDIAVVVFDEGTFSGMEQLSIASKKPKEGTQVRLVGYGCTTIKKSSFFYSEVECDSNETSSKKRTGTNFVVKRDYCTINMIQLNRKDAKVDSEISNPTGEDADTAPGDSGSPVLLEEDHSQIVGITSYGPTYYGENKPGCYANPRYKKNKAFLKEAVQSSSIGAKINGLSLD